MDSTFELVRDLERYLAALSKLYALDKKHLLQQLLVNAKIRAIEGYSHDNIDGGVDGHALQFMLPESLFLSVAKNKDELGKQICSDLNSVHNVRDEFFEAVWLEMDLVPETDWRHESGVAIAPTRIVPSAAASRIWEPHCFRLFLSHKATVKKQVGDLKITLRIFGISAFVAHEDVKPTKEWQDEIENALASMDAFAALMTETYVINRSPSAPLDGDTPQRVWTGKDISYGHMKVFGSSYTDSWQSFKHCRASGPKPPLK